MKSAGSYSWNFSPVSWHRAKSQLQEAMHAIVLDPTLPRSHMICAEPPRKFLPIQFSADQVLREDSDEGNVI
jgi:hypothetical protein